jgi:hypothetical protein
MEQAIEQVIKEEIYERLCVKNQPIVKKISK